MQAVRLINLAVSLGGTESLIEHPATMTHSKDYVAEDEYEGEGISDGLIRFRFEQCVCETMLHARVSVSDSRM